MDEKNSLKSPHYIAYLLRFWGGLSAEPNAGLRMMLIDLRTGKQWNFSDIERLFDFLEEKVLPDDCTADHV